MTHGGGGALDVNIKKVERGRFWIGMIKNHCTYLNSQRMEDTLKCILKES